MVRRRVAWVFIGILLLQSGGLFPVWQQWQRHHRRQVKQQLESTLRPADLTALRLTAAAFEHLDWEEDGREFWYEGQLYDLHQTKKNDGYITLYALPDHQEQAMIKHLMQEAPSQPFGQKAAWQLLQLMALVGVVAALFSWQPQLFITSVTDFTKIHTNRYRFLFYRKFSPPPQLN